MNNWIRFDSIEIKRDGYYVKYDPLVIGYAENIAFASVRILKNKSPQECKEIAEQEFNYWISRFNVPLQINVRDEKSCCSQSVSKLTGCSYICGVTPEIYRWGGFLAGELEKFTPNPNNINRIYEELSVTTSSEVNARLDIERKGRALFRCWVITSVVIIPALIAFLGWSNPVFSAMALLYALYKCADKWLWLSGRKIKTETEEEKDKEQFLKEHHHYHCMQNPKGFEKMKLENFRNSQASKLDKKLAGMAGETSKK